MQIGPYPLPNNLFVAPMAGVTDRPFRQLCRQFGAGYAVSEMVTSRPDLWASLKTSRRANHDGEPGPIAVQIAGTDADMMAQAAQYNISRGAQIIDINIKQTVTILPEISNTQCACSSIGIFEGGCFAPATVLAM